MRISKEAKETVQRLKYTVNTPKSHLIEIYRELQDIPGAKGHANKLGKIISQLEAWQAK